MSNKFPTHKDHLNKTFFEELSYKFWITKGIRFRASRRLLTKNDLSNKALAFLSVYLIILSLLFVYNIINPEIVSSNFIAFGTTTLSILILVFSQMEYAQDYKTRALQFHDCALKISSLYDQIRIKKTLIELSEKKKAKICNNLSGKYESILENYPNHNDIDYKAFQLDHYEYFSLKWNDKLKIQTNYYFQVKLIYHILIFIPAILIILALLFYGS